jgi:peptidoglycan L-alanyl-D-glutamate endopeptidase CwlK
MSRSLAPVPGSSETTSLDSILLKPGDSGEAVRTIQQKLLELGFSLGSIDGSYGPMTQNAVAAFQQAQGFDATGFVDEQTMHALGYQANYVSSSTLPSNESGFTVELVSKLFPSTALSNIRQYLPSVLNALSESSLGDRAMSLMALATIRVETAGS